LGGASHKQEVDERRRKRKEIIREGKELNVWFFSTVYRGRIGAADHL
jgi:hypothetical protein